MGSPSEVPENAGSTISAKRRRGNEDKDNSCLGSPSEVQQKADSSIIVISDEEVEPVSEEEIKAIIKKYTDREHAYQAEKAKEDAATELPVQNCLSSDEEADKDEEAKKAEAAEEAEEDQGDQGDEGDEFWENARALLQRYREIFKNYLPDQ